MLLWLKELTGSATLMGVAMLMTNLPESIFAPAGGVISDRIGKVRTMISADIMSAIAVCLVVLAVFALVDIPVLVTILCLSNIVVGMSSACFTPAASALVPELVQARDLSKGNAAHQFCNVGGRILGQGIGGILFAALGILGALLVNATSFMISAITEMQIVPPEKPAIQRPITGTSILSVTRTMLRRILSTGDLRQLLLFIAAFHLCLSVLPVSLPFYAEYVLNISDYWYGLLVGSYTLGIMIGFIMAGTVSPGADRFHVIAAAGLVSGVLFGVVALTESMWIALSVLTGIGIGIGVIIVNLTTELQLQTGEAERGGMMGAAQAVGGSSLPVGMAVTGILIDSLVLSGVSYGNAVLSLLAISGISSVLLGFMALRIRRRYTC